MAAKPTPDLIGSAANVRPLALRTKEAARAIGVSPRLLASLTSCDAVPSRKIRGARIYLLSELELWLALGAPDAPGSAQQVREAAARQAARR